MVMKVKSWSPILLAALVSGACASSTPSGPDTAAVGEKKVELYAAIDRVVADEARRGEIKAAVQSFETQAAHLANEVLSHRKAMSELSRKYDATREEFVVLIEDHWKRREEISARALEARGKAVALLTDEEWEQLKEARSESLQALLEQFGLN